MSAMQPWPVSTIGCVLGLLISGAHGVRRNNFHARALTMQAAPEAALKWAQAYVTQFTKAANRHDEYEQLAKSGLYYAELLENAVAINDNYKDPWSSSLGETRDEFVKGVKQAFPSSRRDLRNNAEMAAGQIFDDAVGLRLDVSPTGAIYNLLQGLANGIAHMGFPDGLPSRSVDPGAGRAWVQGLVENVDAGLVAARGTDNEPHVRNAQVMVQRFMAVAAKDESFKKLKISEAIEARKRCVANAKGNAYSGFGDEVYMKTIAFVDLALSYDFNIADASVCSAVASYATMDAGAGYETQLGQTRANFGGGVLDSTGVSRKK